MSTTTFVLNGGRRCSISKKNILDAMSWYNKNCRSDAEDSGRLYAVRHNSTFYPPKQILARAVGAEVRDFSGGEGPRCANRVFRDLGFEIVYLSADRIPKNCHDPKKINQPIPKIGAVIKALMSQRWTRLHGNYRRQLDVQYPGVYLLAYSKARLEGKKVEPNDVFYVGMTHAGLVKRLRQFIDGIEDGGHHSGAKRFYHTHAEGSPYSQMRGKKTFYVATVAIPCMVNKAHRTPEDLRKMGEVARLEFYVLAHIKELTRKEPELNLK